VSLIAVSFALAYLFQRLLLPLQMTLDRFAWLAYLSVFVTTLLSNLTIVAPVPVATGIMIAAATKWNPALVAFAASLGGVLGELSGYLVGYFGKKTVINENTTFYDKIAGWMDRYGFWTISFLAMQPVFPFDIAGLIAGSSRMPLRKFLPALWIGKFVKYIILCYLGAGLVRFFP